jgi:hypothetical protein
MGNRPDIVVNGTGGTTTVSSSGEILPHDLTKSYTKGTIVTHNGSLYQARAQVPVNVLPPVEVATWPGSAPAWPARAFSAPRSKALRAGKRLAHRSDDS